MFCVNTSRGLSLCLPTLAGSTVLYFCKHWHCYGSSRKMPKTNKSKIPDRWEAYTKMGSVIEGTTIMPIKVPLRESLSSWLASDERFSPSALLTLIEEKDLKLCGVVDLTYTTKYYDSLFFRQHGVGYKKVFTAGRVIPSDKNFDQFASAIQTLEKEGEVICVHCTHGLNRSGYMICRYMIEVLNIDPETAIRLFEQARGHKMERQNYIDDLTRRTPGVRTVAEAGPGDPNSHQAWKNDESGWNQDYHSCHRRDRALAWREKGDNNFEDRRHWNRDAGSGTVENDRSSQHIPRASHIVWDDDDDESSSPHQAIPVDDTRWNSGFHSNNPRNYSSQRGRNYENRFQWQQHGSQQNGYRQGYDSVDHRSNFGNPRNQGPYGSDKGWGSSDMREEGRNFHNNWRGRGRRNGDEGGWHGKN